MNKFKERFSHVLKNSNLSQSAFAREINMSVSIVNNYCTGKREPSLDTLILISKALGETTDYLLGADEF